MLEGPGLKVVRKDHDWGDCYRVFGSFPTVYRLSRPRYDIYIAHGQRYWPEVFLRAQTKDGAALQLSGPNLSVIEHPNGGNFTRLKNARGFEPTHKLDLRYFSDVAIKITVLDSQQHVLGRESISYHLEDVRCFGWDAV